MCVARETRGPPTCGTHSKGSLDAAKNSVSRTLQLNLIQLVLHRPHSTALYKHPIRIYISLEPKSHKYIVNIVSNLQLQEYNLE